MNLVTKRRDESDDRQVKVALTDRGRALKDEMAEIPCRMSEKFSGNEALMLELKNNLDLFLKIMFE